MPMQYPPLSDGTYRYGDPPRPLPSPIPGPDPTGPAGAPGPPPPPGGPCDGPPPAAAPGEKRPGGTGVAAAIVGGLALVVVVVLGLALFGPGSEPDRGHDPGRASAPLPPPAAPPAERAPGATFSVEGRFTVATSPGEPVSGDGTGCDLPVSLSDLGEGTRITLSEGPYDAIGSTLLAYDGGDLSSCTFTFGFEDVPSGASFYVVEIPGRGQLTYTEDELRAGVDITLGR
ncbi:MAG TPA: hypothetical protein PKC36_05900 [Dietzia sp.]|nr:hypothetical protein [Dietzia sp.]